MPPELSLLDLYIIHRRGRSWLQAWRTAFRVWRIRRQLSDIK